MYKQIIALTLLSLATVSYANLVGWRDCGSPLAAAKVLRVTNCTHTPCIFVRGQTYEIAVDAGARGYSDTLRFETSAMVLGLRVVLISGDACNQLTMGSCPVDYGSYFTFIINYTVPTTLPPISSVVMSEVWTDNNVRGICMEIDATLT